MTPGTFLTILENSPRYEHDCKMCVYLGQWARFDLYACGAPQEERGKQVLSTVIARESSEPSDYASGLHVALRYSADKECPEYQLALHVALCRALYSEKFVRSETFDLVAGTCMAEQLKKQVQ